MTQVINFSVEWLTTFALVLLFAFCSEISSTNASNCSQSVDDYYFDYIVNDGSYDVDTDNVCVICQCFGDTNSTCAEYRYSSEGVDLVNAYCNLTVSFVLYCITTVFLTFCKILLSVF